MSPLAPYCQKKMIADTPTNRILIRTIIVFFQSYAPLCVGYITWSLLASRWPACSFGIESSSRYLLRERGWLWRVCLAEAIFYLFFFSLWYKKHVQREALHPPLRTRAERENLFRKCQREILDPEAFLSGWFRGANPEDIGREELKRFLNWSFWDGRARVAGEKEDDGDANADAAEIEQYIDKMSVMMPQPFLPGAGKAKSLRLTLDPVEIEARSLLWYALIMLADTLSQVLLQAKGFAYHRRSLWKTAAAVFPPRPAAFFTRSTSVAPSISYFLREHHSHTRLPVLYIHGIGIGLLPSVQFLSELDHELNHGRSSDDQVGILAIEVLQISSRLTESIPRRADFLAQLTTIINHHFGPDSRFVLGAHSYGTILSANILNDDHLSPRVSATLLVDPVSFMLHMPDVAYNFTCRKPVRANEWLLWYFASKDPQIAHTLGRHFFWTENILWRDQVDGLIERHGLRITASISSADLIVSAKAVRAYLESNTTGTGTCSKQVDGSGGVEKQERELHRGVGSETWKGQGLETIWWEGYDHGDVYDSKEDRARLIRALVHYCQEK